MGKGRGRGGGKGGKYSTYNMCASDPPVLIQSIYNIYNEDHITNILLFYFAIVELFELLWNVDVGGGSDPDEKLEMQIERNRPLISTNDILFTIVGTFYSLFFVFSVQALLQNWSSQVKVCTTAPLV